jgi:hypothetical protein
LIHVIRLKHIKIARWHLLPDKAAQCIGGHNFPLQSSSHYAGRIHLKCRNSSFHWEIDQQLLAPT